MVKHYMEAVRQESYKKNGQVIDLAIGKAMPSATDVEAVVLGAMIIDKSGVEDAMMVITTEEVFYDEKHRLVFRAIMELYRDAVGIDVVTVSQKLRSMNLLNDAGGDYYILHLSQMISSSAHMEFHCRILVQYYIRRQLIRDASILMSQAYNDEKDSLELLEDFGKVHDTLSQQVLVGRREKSYKQGLQEVKNRVEFLTHRGPEEITGVSTGFANADRFTCGYQPQDLIIYAARPGMGKTSVMLSGVMANVKRGDAVGIISAEMSAYQLNARTVAMESSFHLRQLTKSGFEHNRYFITLNEVIDRMQSYGIYTDDTATPDIEHVRVQARLWHRKHGIKALYVDYLQLLKDVSVKNNREQEISSISRKLKGLAKELNIPVIALSQLSRAVETRGSSKRPLLSDLRESGAIEQDADAVVFIYRPEYYKIEPEEDILAAGGDSELIFAKYRGGAPNERIALKWIGDKTKYYDPEEYASWSSTVQQEYTPPPVQPASPNQAFPPDDNWSIEDKSKPNGDDTPF